LVSDYDHVFVRLSVVIVTLPTKNSEPLTSSVTSHMTSPQAAALGKK